MDELDVGRKMALFQWRSSDFWQWYTSNTKRPTARQMLNYLEGFSEFECFHGCRIESPDSYYDKGFLVHDEQDLRRQAARLLGVGMREIDSVCDSVRDLDEGKVFFVLDEQHLLEHCGHYLIYGSERITAYAASLSRLAGSDLRERLKNCGDPTVFRVNLPRELIAQESLESLAEYIPALTWEDFSSEDEAPRIDWTFIQKQSVPPSCIVGLTRPTVIHDPLHWGSFYRHQQSG